MSKNLQNKNVQPLAPSTEPSITENFNLALFGAAIVRGLKFIFRPDSQNSNNLRGSMSNDSNEDLLSPEIKELLNSTKEQLTKNADMTATNNNPPKKNKPKKILDNLSEKLSNIERRERPLNKIEAETQQKLDKLKSNNSPYKIKTRELERKQSAIIRQERKAIRNASRGEL